MPIESSASSVLVSCQLPKCMSLVEHSQTASTIIEASQNVPNDYQVVQPESQLVKWITTTTTTTTTKTTKNDTNESSSCIVEVAASEEDSDSDLYNDNNEHLLMEIVTLNRALIAAREGNLNLLQVSVANVYGERRIVSNISLCDVQTSAGDLGKGPTIVRV